MLRPAGRQRRARLHAPLAALHRHLPRWADDSVLLQGRHLLGAGRGRDGDSKDARRVLRVRARVEPRRHDDRVRVGPVRRLRRVRHAGGRRRGDTADVPFDRRDPRQLHGRRQGGAVLRLPPGAGDRRAVPGRHHDAALLRRRHRRPRLPGAAHAGAGRDDRRLGRAVDLSRRQGIRERLAEAPHLVGHARCVGVRPQEREVPPADPVQRRGSESRVRRQRERLLLLERAERVVQRLQELAGQSVAIHRAHPLHEKSRPVPVARDERHAVFHVRRRGATRSSRAATPARSRFRLPRRAAARATASSRSTTASPRRRSRRTARSSPTCSAARSS